MDVHHRKRKPGQKNSIFYRLLMVLCVAGIVVSGGMLISNLKDYWQGNAAYDQVRSAITERDPKGKDTLNIDFTVLAGINKDVVGWIRGCDLIDYPIVQGEDNDYYLTRLFDRKQNKLGTIFMDYRNSGDFSDKNTVLYGHNMKDGSMFAPLTKYKKQSFYDNFPEMTLYTPGGNYMIEFFAGIVADGNQDLVPFDFTDDQEFLGCFNRLKEQSTFESGVILKPEDRVVTLYTCSYEFDNARYILYGKLTPVSFP